MASPFVLPSRVVTDPGAQLNFEKLQGTVANLQSQIAALQTSTGTVTALPTSPTDGQVIYYLADATNGVVWAFRYRTASSSSFKWEWIGGTPLVAGNRNTSSGATGTSYVNIGGLSLTIPLNGDYILRHSATTYPTTNTAGQISIALFVNGSGPNLEVLNYSPVQSGAESFNTEGIITNMTASSVVDQRINSNSSGVTAVAAYRALVIQPIRVG